MAENIRVAGMKASSRRERLLEWFRSDGGFWLLGHVSSSCKGQILTTTDVPHPSVCAKEKSRELGEKFLSALRSS